MFEATLPVKIHYKGYDIVIDYLDEASHSSKLLTIIHRPTPDAPSFQFTCDCPVKAELRAKEWIDSSLVGLE